MSNRVIQVRTWKCAPDKSREVIALNTKTEEVLNFTRVSYINNDPDLWYKKLSQAIREMGKWLDKNHSGWRW